MANAIELVTSVHANGFPRRIEGQMSEPLHLPRGMSRVQAAAYVGVSPSLFDAMVQDRRMPGPKLINSRTVWDRFALDLAFEARPGRRQ